MECNRPTEHETTHDEKADNVMQVESIKNFSASFVVQTMRISCPMLVDGTHADVTCISTSTVLRTQAASWFFLGYLN